MIDTRATALLDRLDVPHETRTRLELFVAELARVATTQNLISRSSLEDVWVRHVIDSLQLAPFAAGKGSWIDVGAGAGFPGLVIALASSRPVLLVEPRAMRAAFLTDMVTGFGLVDQVQVFSGKVERVPRQPFDVISARAVASLDRLFAAAQHLAHSDTIWLLPKGRTAAEELAVTRRTWQGDFRLVPSITDPAASIVVARDVQRRSNQ